MDPLRRWSSLRLCSRRGCLRLRCGGGQHLHTELAKFKPFVNVRYRLILDLQPSCQSRSPRITERYPMDKRPVLQFCKINAIYEIKLQATRKRGQSGELKVAVTGSTGQRKVKSVSKSSQHLQQSPLQVGALTALDHLSADPTSLCSCSYAVLGSPGDTAVGPQISRPSTQDHHPYSGRRSKQWPLPQRP